MKLTQVEFTLPFSTDSREVEAFTSKNGLGILKSIDNTPKWGDLLHISISHKHRYPSWDEIVLLKNHFFGDMDVMMILPKKEDYVNVHKNCFHLWQTPESWGLQ